MSNLCIIVTIVVYLAAMLLVGFAYSKSNNDSTDFYLGGRKMGPLVTAMSAEASDMSSWLLMGMPGLAYLSGIASPGWTAIGLAVGTYINWLVVAKRLRRYTVVANNSITLPDFFSNRFHDKNRILMCVSALVILVIIIRTLVWGDPVSGWPSMACIVFMVSGVQLLCLGILGQYLSKTYLETKKRPIFILKDSSDDKEQKHERA